MSKPEPGPPVRPPGRRIHGFWRWSALIALIAAIAVATPLGTELLQAAGWALVFTEPVTAVDAIVVAVDVDRSGTIEAADLVAQGIAQRVAVFTDPPSPADQEAARRGLAVTDDYSGRERDLRALGVEQVERIPTAVTGSEDQGRVLADWSRSQGLGSVVIVTGADHSRRVRRILNRTMRGHSTRVVVRAARYSDFNPDSWWQRRSSLREGIEELQKLLLDVVRHPLS